MPGGSISALIHGLRWQDAADVLLLTVIFSWAYTWMRRTIAVQVAFGMTTLVVASWLSNHFGLILTSYLLSAVSAVATVVIVVIFQREIRRGLSRVSPLRWMSERHRRKLSAGPTAIVAETAFALAERRKGALIVIPRRDWVGEFVSGGTPVDARLSPALLEAVFTSTSPLHDGAVLISNDSLLRAGVVLPLAAETGDPRHGTRHRAALGLATVCDALVVCASEETGAVTLAHDGALVVVQSARELGAAIERLGAGKPMTTRPNEHPRRMRDLFAYVTIFAGVVAAWSAMSLDRSHVVVRIVPLEIRGVSETIRFDPPRNTSIAVELRSSQNALDLLVPDSVEAYVNVSGSTAGLHTFRVLSNAPAGVEVVSTVPSTVSLQIRSADRK
jgi:uncharacterized protein (TIGR00159 family)